MKKAIVTLNLTALMISICSPVICAKESEKSNEINKIEYQAKKKEQSHNIVDGVEQKIHEVTEKSKEIVHSVKDNIEQRQYEHNMKTAHVAKAKAEQKAHALQVQSVESAQHAQESAARAKQIAELIEAEQIALAEEGASTDPMPTTSKDPAQQKYENYLRAAQRAKEKADHDAFYYQLKSKKAAEQAYESALNANIIAKHIETEQKAHVLNEKFQKAMHVSDNKN